MANEAGGGALKPVQVGPLPIAEVVRHAYNAGFKGDALVTAVAIAKAENSTHDPARLGDLKLQDKKWGASVGLWQIRSLNADFGTGRTRDFVALHDPAFNARSAYTISGGGTNFEPWTVYSGKDAKYKQHLQAATAAVAGSGAAVATVPTGPPVLSTSTTAEGKTILVALGGGPDAGNVGRVVVGGSCDFSTQEVSEMTLVIEDKDLELTRLYELNVGTVVERYGLHWQAVEIQTTQGPAHPHVILRCHPSGAVRMRTSTPSPVTQTSPTDYMRSLAESAGLRFIGEPSAPRDIGPATVDDVKGRITVSRLQNAWEVGVYWAGQLGFLAFEAAGTYYFGSPRFLAQQGQKVQISYASYSYPQAEQGPAIAALEVPTCRASRREFIKAGTVVPGPNGTSAIYRDQVDSLDDKTITATVERELGLGLRPAMCVAVAGVPPFDGTFLLMTRVSWDIGEQVGPVTVEAATAETLAAPARTPEDDAAARGTGGGGTRAQSNRIKTAERIRLFGQPGDKVRTVTVATPFGLKVTVHALIRAQFEAACADAFKSSKWRPVRMDSYNVRKIAGTSDWSLHSFGLAFDIFNTANPRDVWGAENAPDSAFREAFRRHGFYLGADFRRKADYPHVEWASTPP